MEVSNLFPQAVHMAGLALLMRGVLGSSWAIPVCDNSRPVLEAQELCLFQIRILAKMDNKMLTAHLSSTSDAPVDVS